MSARANRQRKKKHRDNLRGWRRFAYTPSRPRNGVRLIQTMEQFTRIFGDPDFKPAGLPLYMGVDEARGESLTAFYAAMLGPETKPREFPVVGMEGLDEELVPAGVRIVEVEPMLAPIPHPVFVSKEDERNGVN